MSFLKRIFSRNKPEIPTPPALQPLSPSDMSVRFILDGCDLSPQHFRAHTVETVEKSITTRLKNGIGFDSDYSLERKKAFTKVPADASRGFFCLGFEHESGLLKEVCVDAKCPTDFLGVRSRESERVLLQAGFKKIGKFKDRPTSWVIWKYREDTSLYSIIQSHLDGRLIEIYYLWRYKPYLDEDVDWF